MATLSSLSGIIAAVLTAVGAYGIISYAVVHRTNEISIRMALGAGRGAVIALVLRETAIVLVVGLAVGTLLTLAVGRDVVVRLSALRCILAVASLSLVVLSAGASYLPALRAAKLNPVVALRQD